MPKKSRADIISSDDAMLNEVGKVIRLKEGRLAIGDSVDQQGRNNMRTKGIFVTLFVTANLAGAAFALAQGNGNGRGNGGGGGGGGEDPPPTVFEPEFGYIQLGGRNQDDEVILVDRTGSTEVSVYSTPEDIRGIALATESAGLIAFSTIQGNVYIQRWGVGANGFGVEEPIRIFPTQSFPNNDPIVSIDFSPDGRSLAIGDGYDNRIYLYDVETGSLSAVAGLEGWEINEIQFNPAGTGIFFTGVDNPALEEAGIYEYIFGQAAPASPVIPRYSQPGVTNYYESWDVGYAHDTNDPFIVSQTGAGDPIFWSLQGARLTKPFQSRGTEFRINCENSALMHWADGDKGRGNMAVTYIGGASEDVGRNFWGKRTAWMPQAYCEQ